jgi:hypothetical protein
MPQSLRHQNNPEPLYPKDIGRRTMETDSNRIEVMNSQVSLESKHHRHATGVHLFNVKSDRFGSHSPHHH